MLERTDREAVVDAALQGLNYASASDEVEVLAGLAVAWTEDETARAKALELSRRAATCFWGNPKELKRNEIEELVERSLCQSAVERVSTYEMLVGFLEGNSLDEEAAEAAAAAVWEFVSVVMPNELEEEGDEGKPSVMELFRKWQTSQLSPSEEE
jgi:hypothetical protein